MNGYGMILSIARGRGFLLKGLLFLCAFCLSGCGKGEQHMLSFPLREGNVWVYSGEYITRISSRAIRVPVYNHTLKLSATTQRRGITYLEGSLCAETSPVLSFLLREKDGALLKYGEKGDEILFPALLRKGTQWEVSFLDYSRTLTVKGFEEIKVPAGNFKAIRVAVTDTRAGRGNVWLANGTGIIALEFSDSGSGPARSMRLELVSFSRGKQ